jgi:hypothetical protein
VIWVELEEVTSRMTSKGKGSCSENLRLTWKPFTPTIWTSTRPISTPRAVLRLLLKQKKM